MQKLEERPSYQMDFEECQNCKRLDLCNARKP